MLKPRQPVPELSVLTTDGKRWTLREQQPANFTMIVFYRGLQAKREWGLDALTVGYGLDLEVARAWGLYISTSRGKTSLGIVEPERFSEPGLFLIRPDQTLYAAIIHTMPFARPHFAEVVAALDFILEHDYPARGEA